MNAPSVVSTDDQRDIEISESDVALYRRLDQCLAERCPDLSRTFIKKCFEMELISSDSPLSLKRMPPAGTVITILVPPPPPADALPENIPLEIIFEDEHLLLVNKPAGLVTHPAPGHFTGTLVNAILFHCREMQREGSGQRPGIVHRLDMGTSGVMVVAKTRECHEGLVDMFSRHDIERVYETLVVAKSLLKSGRLESLIGRHRENRLKMTSKVSEGRRAVTYYTVQHSNNLIHHLHVRLETGRTHQIRVHLSELLHAAVLNDSLYGNPTQDRVRLGSAWQSLIGDYSHPFLHARTLGFKHPITGESISATVESPLLFQNALKLAYNDSTFSGDIG